MTARRRGDRIPGGAAAVRPRSANVDALAISDSPDWVPLAPPGGPPGSAAGEVELREWWEEVARREVEQVAPKAVEYSAADLDIMGYVLRNYPAAVDSAASAADAAARAAELACAYYLLGKIARMFGAYHEGRMPSDDCVHDINVYGRMIQRIRETGSWPGVTP